jgi:hypothetical protein
MASATVRDGMRHERGAGQTGDGLDLAGGRAMPTCRHIFSCLVARGRRDRDLASDLIPTAVNGVTD